MGGFARETALQPLVTSQCPVALEQIRPFNGMALLLLVQRFQLKKDALTQVQAGAVVAHHPQQEYSFMGLPWGAQIVFVVPPLVTPLVAAKQAVKHLHAPMAHGFNQVAVVALVV
jgi:hypothetical protein